MSATKLKNAPLKEVIFELYWNGGPNPDDGFDLAQGKFAQKMSSRMPTHKKRFDNVSLHIIGIPIHQYWAGELVWPVVQHGDGILAVNQTEEGYEWTTYSELISFTLDSLKSSYEKDIDYTRVRLQYIDMWDLNSEDALEFVGNKLMTSLSTKYVIPGSMEAFSITQTFDQGDDTSLSVAINKGRNAQTKKNAVVLTTTIERTGKLDFNDIPGWLNTAHDSASQTFKKILNPDFYATLDA